MAFVNCQLFFTLFPKNFLFLSFCPLAKLELTFGEIVVAMLWFADTYAG